MKTPIEIELDLSRFEAILKELCPCFPDKITFKSLSRATALGFELDGTSAMWTNGTPRAVFKPLGFMLKLLPTVRAGKLSFSDFKSILNAKRRIWDESNHNA